MKVESVQKISLKRLKHKNKDVICNYVRNHIKGSLLKQALSVINKSDIAYYFIVQKFKKRQSCSPEKTDNIFIIKECSFLFADEVFTEGDSWIIGKHRDEKIINTNIKGVFYQMLTNRVRLIIDKDNYEGGLNIILRQSTHFENNRYMSFKSWDIFN